MRGPRGGTWRAVGVATGDRPHSLSGVDQTATVVTEPVAASPAHLVELRRDLHQHPEPRFVEHRTAGILAERLERLGYRVRTGVGGTGVVGTLEAATPGPWVVLRADMDALPVTDDKTVPYASRTSGVAHACGHDVHMVVVLGVAERLAAQPPSAGRVSVVFQPAEERPFGEPSGAQAMLDDGLFADGVPTAVLGLHCWPGLPAGTVGVDEAIAMGAKDAFSIELRGAAAHAATPSRGRDAILGLGSLIVALHGAMARGLDAADRAAFNIGTVTGGRSQSVLAETASLTGTLRTVDPGVRARLRASVEQVTAGVAQGFGLTSTLRWADEMPPVVNDRRLVALALDAASRAGLDTRSLTDPPMTADDFALLGAQAPALYLKLGVADPAAREWPPLHSGSFDVDERCIGVGIRALHALATEVLTGGLERQEQA